MPEHSKRRIPFAGIVCLTVGIAVGYFGGEVQRALVWDNNHALRHMNRYLEEENRELREARESAVTNILPDPVDDAD